MKIETLKFFYINYRIFIFPGIIAVCCLILLLTIILPQSAVFFSDLKSEKNISDKIANIERKIADLSQLNQTELETGLQTALMLYPGEKDLIGAISTLQQAMSGLGFIPGSMQIGSGSLQKSGGQNFSITTVATGPKELVGTLINSIENSGRVMRISSISISPGLTNDSSAANFNIEVLYSPLISQSVSIDKPVEKLTDQETTLINKYAQSVTVNQMPVGTLGPRGKENPFE